MVKMPASDNQGEPTRSREPWRPRFHISPASGRLNDPNGVLIDSGRLHVFYQIDPYFPHMPKRTGWGHASVAFADSEGGGDPLGGGDVPHIRSEWRYHPDALTPNRDYDRDGCYSGSAVRDADGHLHFFYTGNVRDGGNGQRTPTQNRVDVEDVSGRYGGIFRRPSSNPAISDVPDGFTGHVRDPHVTRDPESERGGWRMVLGAQRAKEAHRAGSSSDSTHSSTSHNGSMAAGHGDHEASELESQSGVGSILLYRSNDLKNWDIAGELTFDTGDAQPGGAPDLVPAGYMWECPNLVRMRDAATGEDCDVLVFCPQGLEPKAHHYASSDQCGYIVGVLEGTVFHVKRGFSELDFGHEFYAPQLIASHYVGQESQATNTDEGDRSGSTAFADSADSGHDSDALDVVADEAILMAWAGLPGADDQPSVADGWVHCLTMPRRVRLVAGRLVQQFIMTQSTTADLASGDIDYGEIPASSMFGAVSTVRQALPEPHSRKRLAVMSENGVEIRVDMVRNRAGDLLVRLDRSQQNYHAGDDVRGVMILAEDINNFEHFIGRPELVITTDASVMEIQVVGYTLTSRVFLDRGDSWFGVRM